MNILNRIRLIFTLPPKPKLLYDMYLVEVSDPNYNKRFLFTVSAISVEDAHNQSIDKIALMPVERKLPAQ